MSFKGNSISKLFCFDVSRGDKRFWSNTDNEKKKSTSWYSLDIEMKRIIFMVWAGRYYNIWQHWFYGSAVITVGAKGYVRFVGSCTDINVF